MIAYTTLACAAVIDLTIYFCRPNVQFRVAQMDIWEKICRPNVLSPNDRTPFSRYWALSVLAVTSLTFTKPLSLTVSEIFNVECHAMVEDL